MDVSPTLQLARARAIAAGRLRNVFPGQVRAIGFKIDASNRLKRA